MLMSTWVLPVSAVCAAWCVTFTCISGVRSDVYQWWCVPCLGGNICCCLQCFRAHHVGHFGWQVLIQGRTAVAVDSEMCGGFGCLARFSSTGVLQGFTRFGETGYWLVSWCFEPSQPQDCIHQGWKQTSVCLPVIQSRSHYTTSLFFLNHNSLSNILQRNKHNTKLFIFHRTH